MPGGAAGSRAGQRAPGGGVPAGPRPTRPARRGGATCPPPRGAGSPRGGRGALRVLKRRRVVVAVSHKGFSGGRGC